MKSKEQILKEIEGLEEMKTKTKLLKLIDLTPSHIDFGIKCLKWMIK